MVHNRRYHTVIFDVGGTLVGFEDDAPFAEFLATVDTPHPYASATELRCKMIHTLSIRRDEVVGIGLDDDSINNWWLTIFDDLFPHNPTAARRMWLLFKDNYFDSHFSDTLPILNRLKARGVPMGIISNYGTHLLDLLPKLELFDYFNFVIVSAIVGVTKPNPRIFEIAIEEAKAAPDQILYVGDNYLDDIVGANNVGMDAVLINRPGRKPATAPVTIDSLLDIEKLVFPNEYSERKTEERFVNVQYPYNYGYG
ncbi:MAG TPA: HAD family hydrolase [Anaerolineae bacterium]|nr:HAD family hydrolase [Anaerolineae bacterium]